MSTSVTDVILHCQKQFKKNLPDDKLLHYLRRLRRLRIKLKDLVETGVGRSVNQLSRHEGVVGAFAEKLVAEWKELVEAESGSQSASPDSSPNRRRRSHKHKQRRRASSDADEEEEEEEEEDEDDDTNLQIKQELEELQGFCDDEDEDDEEGLVINEEENRNHFRRRQEESESSDEEEVPTQKYVKVKIKEEPKPRNPTPPSSDAESEDEPPIQAPLKIKQEKLDSEEEGTDRRIDKEDRRHRHKHKSKSKERHSHGHVKVKEEPSTTDKHGTDKEKRHQKTDTMKKEKERRSSPEFEFDPKQKKIKEEKSDKGDKGKEEKKKVEARMLQGAIDSTSGLNFEAVLGCLDSVKGKPTASSRHSGSKSKSSSPQKPSPEKLKIKKEKEEEEGAKKRVAHSKSISPPTGVKIKEEHKSKSKTPSASVKFNGDHSSKLTLDPHYKPSAVSRIVAAPAPKSRRSSALKSEILRSLAVAGDEDDEGVVSSTTNGSSHPQPSTSRHALAAAAVSSSWAGDTLATMIVSRKQKTKVYSGVKTGYYGAVPSLFDMCLRVIQENIDDLGYTGGVPFDILKPVLERASVGQLLQIEHYNPYLIESTGELWAFHCKRDFRGEKRKEEDLESWRELYSRCVEAREKKFESARRKVGENYENKPAQRKAKLAYVEAGGRGPKFSKSKTATIQNGMKTLKLREDPSGFGRGMKRPADDSAMASGSNKARILEEAAVVIAAGSRAGSAPGSVARDQTLISGGGGGPPNKKAKKAPLMQKTLMAIKRFRR